LAYAEIIRFNWKSFMGLFGSPCIHHLLNGNFQ